MKVNDKQLCIRVSQKLLDELHFQAMRLGMPDSEFVRKAINNFIHYFKTMPKSKFKNYIQDEKIAARMAEMIEIARYPWVDIDKDK